MDVATERSQKFRAVTDRSLTLDLRSYSVTISMIHVATHPRA